MPPWAEGSGGLVDEEPLGGGIAHGVGDDVEQQVRRQQDHVEPAAPDVPDSVRLADLKASGVPGPEGDALQHGRVEVEALRGVSRPGQGHQEPSAAAGHVQHPPGPQADEVEGEVHVLGTRLVPVVHLGGPLGK